MKTTRSFARWAGAFALAASVAAPAAQAGLFNLPHFVSPGEFAAGLEPEVTFTGAAGFATNLKFTYGITELSNLTALIGTGVGPEQFRVGAAMTFDFFPDIEGQPGIGVALEGIYYVTDFGSQFELTGIPYIHKTFYAGKTEIEPFLGIPLGIGFQSTGQYVLVANLAGGILFKTFAHFRFVVEGAGSLANSQSYVSGGVVYYH